MPLLSDFSKQYFMHSQVTKATKTFLADRSALHALQVVIGDIDLAQIKSDHIERFRLHELQRIRATSVNVALRHLRAAFSWATGHRYIVNNPVAEVKLCRVPHNTHPKFLSVEDVRRLRAAAGDHTKIRQAIDFGLLTGMRRDEIVHLQWSDVDFVRSAVLIESKDDFRTKSRKSRIVPMNESLRSLLSQLKSPETLPSDRVLNISYGWLGAGFKKVVRRAGLAESTSFHVLRHTFASHLVMNGVDLTSVQTILGHHSITVTQIYLHLDPNYLARTVEKLPF